MQSKPEIDKAPTAPTVEALNEVTPTLTKGLNVSNSTALTIAGTAVRQMNGLYSLNDLHKAAGKEEKNKPSEWMRNQQTQDLVSEISKVGIPAFETKRGNGAGIYACKELVIAYAAWISAAFHLKVIRVFLSVAMPVAAESNPAIDYTRISPAQAQDLREIVKAIVDAGIQGHGETWARMQRKFRVNSYLQLPFNRYDEARQYLIAKLPEGHAGDLFEEAAKAQPMDLALIESAMAAASAVGAQIQQAAFMAMLKSESLQRGRWMVSFGYGSDSGKPNVKQIDDGAYSVTLPQLAKIIQEPGSLVESQDLMSLATACMSRLAKRIGGGPSALPA